MEGGREGERERERERGGNEGERGPTYFCVSVRVFSDHKKLPPEVLKLLS